MADIGHILARELGAEQVILRGDERLDDYERDESPMAPHPCDAAALCRTTEEVATVLRLCREHRVPVTPRGVTGTLCSRQSRRTVATSSVVRHRAAASHGCGAIGLSSRS